MPPFQTQLRFGTGTDERYPALAGFATVTVPHGLFGYQGERLTPNWIIPDRSTAIVIDAVDDTNVTITNPVGAAQAFRLFLWYQFTDPAILWQGLANPSNTISPLDFGTGWDGVDVTDALQAALDAAKGTGSPTAKVVMPGGNPILTETVVVPDGVIVEGAGMDATTFHWQGGLDPVFLFSGCQHSRAQDFGLLADAAWLNAFRFQRGDAGEVSSQCELRNILYDAANLGQDGIDIFLNGVDAKNDFHSFYNVQGKRVIGNAVNLAGDQSVSHLFVGCHLQGGSGGQYGIYTTGGNFYWVGGALILWHAANIRLAGGGSATVSIKNCYSEKSYRMLVVDATNLFGVEIDNIYWTSGVADAAADGEVVQFYGNGPLSITRCRWGLNGTVKKRFRYQPGGTSPRAAFRFDANSVKTNESGGMFPAFQPDPGGSSLVNFSGSDVVPVERYVDGTIKVPVWDTDWNACGLPTPDIWGVCQETASPGTLFNCNKRGRGIYNLVPNIAATYQKAVVGYDGYFIEFTHAGDQRFGINDNTVFATADGIAGYISFYLNSATLGDYLLVLGNGSVGPYVRFTSAGFLQLRINSATYATGAVDYRGGGVFRCLAVYDPYDVSGGPGTARFAVYTAQETIGGPGASTVIGNGVNKGIGATDNSIVSFDGGFRNWAFWRGPVVRLLNAASVYGLAA